MHHVTVLAVIFFLIGSALHILMQIDAIARAKNNPYNSRLEILKDRWQTILIRAAWSMVFFTLWLEGQLVAILTAIKIPLPDTAKAILDLHISGAVAFILGYFSDSALAFVPMLNTSIPPAIDKSNGQAPDPPKPA